MGIFSGLFKSRDKPQNRTAGSNYAFFFGGTTSGKAVTERSAMQMTTVYSCVRILSEAVAGLPLHLYKYTDSGGKAMTEEQFDREKRYQASMSMFRTMLKNGLITEEQYAIIDTKMLGKYRPLLGTLFSESTCYSGLSERCIVPERS